MTLFLDDDFRVWSRQNSESKHGIFVRAWDFTIEDAEDFEARWQDADHRARCSINVDRPADDGRIGGELTTPETVAQEHYRVVTRLSVLVEATVSNFLNWARPNPFALCSHKK